MHILFPTGRQSEPALREALGGISAFTYAIVPTGEIASFLTPQKLESLLCEYPCTAAVVSGMCTADFSPVTEKTGVPVFRGTRHAADMRLCVPLILSGNLSPALPADNLLADEKRKEAAEKLLRLEEEAAADMVIRGVKFGGSSRIKVLCEIMDAHRTPALREKAELALASGADGIDLGFGFDAEPADVRRCLEELAGLPCPVSIDTLSPELIRAGLFRADLIFSLTKETLPSLAGAVQAAGCAAVCIPRGNADLAETVSAAKKTGLTRIFADPLLQPPLSGMTASLAGFLPDYGAPKVMGCVNAVELTDADSPGICAMLAASAAETGCAAVLISEHSDKTAGAVSEMRRAVEQMQLCRGRPYPKDAGVDVFVIKEKRKRREPALEYASAADAPAASEENLSIDPCGNFRIGIADGMIVAVRRGAAVRGKTAEDVFAAILAEGGVSLLDHAAYLGRELMKAELAIRFGRSYEQDGAF
ncbi:MAG: DUF4346 domain-containing protein [Methanocorpusculum sp.]|nr:DUF4346 domain-containing protein [Methanocorpusculum sp.]